MSKQSRTSYPTHSKYRFKQKIKNGIPKRKNKIHAVLLKSKYRLADFELLMFIISD
jgi:hypothetical protein